MEKNENREKRYYTVSEFREEMGNTLTRQYIYKLIDEGQIPIRKIGKKILIDGAWARSYINMPCVCMVKEVAK